MESAQQNYIGGSWVPAAATAPNVNPSNTKDVIANYARAQPARRRYRGHARAARRRRLDHAMEFSDRDPGLEDRAGAGLWQLRGVQASRSRAGLGARTGGDHLALRPVRGRVQSRDGTRQP